MSPELVRLFDGSEPRPLAGGAWLFHPGDPVRRMHLVTEGTVALSRVTGTGAPVTLQRARAGQVLAEASAYAAVYHCGACAVAPTMMRALPVARFLARLAQDPELAQAWAAHLAYAVQAARLLAEIRTLRTVAERLDAWLGEDGSLPPKGAWQQVAAELGVTREALYRELARRREHRRLGEPHR
ncbi:Crp/Fnr family transcriptional regulator [Rubrimonas sp.]|uniref:Crp/Fnr family transcriptional regulator n=1 Tax=Rubrimonas sp. TaxID=2036015 RepID=UPI002FDD1A0B